MPFLVSFVLIIVGFYVRRRVAETPVFNELSRRGETQSTGSPILRLFGRYPLRFLLTALLFAGASAAGYMTTGFIQNYTTDPDGSVGMDLGVVLWVVTAASVTWVIFTILGSFASDALGRRRTYVIGWLVTLIAVIALFPLANSANAWLLFFSLVVLTLGLGLLNGGQPALYAEAFPASVRFSGVSIAYAVGAILGGAFAPTIATWLIQVTGSTAPVAAYLAAMTLVGLAATLLLRERSGIPLSAEHESEQAQSAVYGVR